MEGKKRSNLISFKVSEEFLDKLEALQVGDESLSLTVKRISEEHLGIAKPRTTVEERVDTVNSKVDQVLDLLRSLPTELGKVAAQQN
jgi:hypothetical protein